MRVEGEVEVEKGDDVPVCKSRMKFPFDQMVVGDSMFVKKRDYETYQQLQTRILLAWKRYARKNFINLWKITTHKADKDGVEGVRAWIVEDPSGAGVEFDLNK